MDGKEDIIASLLLLEFKPRLFGIGSIVVEPEFRGKGVGAQLIQESLKLHPDAAFMLYSEIGAAYYERFGFRALPESHQSSLQAICMIRADEGLCTQILKEPVPPYF
ncbi:GNAT family N-acetyltransferase [Planococcus liqunii]|nr:GNAT family N-acetyltransferase [Planococcus sp. N056]WKA51891.1 GNAT family N-acetyltransferase [Planococcus sp. N056]